MVPREMGKQAKGKAFKIIIFVEAAKIISLR
jgi:hypothetical protein